eukprot:2098610-Rhodomonas_salina.1
MYAKSRKHRALLASLNTGPGTTRRISVPRIMTLLRRAESSTRQGEGELERGNPSRVAPAPGKDDWGPRSGRDVGPAVTIVMRRNPRSLSDERLRMSVV